MSTRIWTCVALTVAAAALSAQQTLDRPTFKTGVNAVLVDVRVVDRTGRFVSDLASSDFQVLEDGIEQPITAFQLINLPPVAPSTISKSSAPSDVSTNADPAGGRLYVIVLDDIFGAAPQVHPDFDYSGRLPQIVSVKSLARELVFHMSDADRAAIVTTAGRRDMAQEFTNDRGRLLQTIDKFVPNQGQSPDFPVEASAYARPLTGTPSWANTRDDALKSLIEISNWLSAVEGRRKAIVLVSQRLGSVSADTSITNFSRAAGLQDVMTPHLFRQLIQATSRANVTIYTLSPVIVAGFGAELPLPDEYVQAIADARRTGTRVTIAQATGGFSRGGSYDGVFERIAAENGAYYLIGFNSPATGEDGNFHRIEVRTRRADVGVRARTGYVAAPRPTLAKKMMSRDTPLPLAEALQSPSSVAGLPMRMSALPFRRSGSKARLSIVVDVDRSRDAEKPIEVAIAAAQVNGKAADVRRITLAGGTLVSQLELKPGRYHVRAAALDTGDLRKGSVLADVEVPDFSQGRLTMSAIELADDAQPATAVGIDTHWKTELGTPPTTNRVFSGGALLTGYVEVYDNERRVSSEIELVTTVKDEDGRAMFDDRIQSVQTREKGVLPAHRVRFITALKDLPSGKYLLEVEAHRTNAAQSKSDIVSRQIPFAIGER
ncbi:MAG TPA: VWA domain-containing protein [Vicinamibacterales bacterium]|jgi:VWFA-related protein|nr:VWA domain-containing protein [Vicinamibacterales bacterium]